MKVSLQKTRVSILLLLAIAGCATPGEYRFENQRTAFHNPLLEQTAVGASVGSDGVLYSDTVVLEDDPYVADIVRLNERIRNGDFATPDPSATGTQIGGVKPKARSIIPNSDRP